MSTIQADIEARLAESEPKVEVLLAEVIRGSTVRLFIDHPDGVSLELCERVTKQLVELRETYALEVTSPLGVAFAPQGTRALNLAFDVTPAELITAIVTEAGVLEAPYEESIRRALS